jgi:hypothetical protein
MTNSPRPATPIEMPPLVGQLAEIWRALAQLAEHAGDLRWTVVGGQMVMLHGLEHGTTPDRVSNDIDAAVDVRADPQAVTKLVRVLTTLGFENAGVSPDGHAYRYRRGGAAHLTIDVMVDQPEPNDLIVDVLVPDNLGERANIRTVGTATAFPAPGVHQALQRTERVAISIAGTIALIPRPNLLGAIVAKATACAVDNRDTGRHHTDLAFLCGLVRDPIELSAHVTRSDRRRLTRAAEILPENHPIWRLHPDALATLEILCAPPK